MINLELILLYISIGKGRDNNLGRLRILDNVYLPGGGGGGGGGHS